MFRNSHDSSGSMLLYSRRLGWEIRRHLGGTGWWNHLDRSIMRNSSHHPLTCRAGDVCVLEPVAKARYADRNHAAAKATEGGGHA